MQPPPITWEQASREVHALYEGLAEDASRARLNHLWSPERQQAFLAFLAYALTPVRTGDVPDDVTTLPSWDIVEIAVLSLDDQGRSALIDIVMRVAHPAVYRVLAPSLRRGVGADEMEAAVLQRLNDEDTSIRRNACLLAEALFNTPGTGYTMSLKTRQAVHDTLRELSPPATNFYIPDF